MKRFIFSILSLGLMATSFNVAIANEYNNEDKKSKNICGDEFKEFLISVIPKGNVLDENYEKCRLIVGQVISALEIEDSLDRELQKEAIGIIIKAQKKLEEFRETVETFQNSSNQNVRRSVKELLKVNEYEKVVLEQYYNLIFHPNQFLSSEEGATKLYEYTLLFKNQSEYVMELIKEISEVELANPKETAEKVEFQYSNEELKVMDRWKNKTMNEMIFDANNGDAVALYMLGMAHLYGKGGFPINVKQADKYFATSALLGFAPAMDKIKSMYLEDNDNPNPFLVLVYVNLTASFGHPEFTMVYHDRRKCIVEKFGNAMANEIERIATQKAIKIYKAMNQLDESENKMKTTFNFLFVEDGIIGEDVEFVVEYWEKFLIKK